jgi:hypothetical protein
MGVRAAFAYATAALSPTMDIANAVLLTLPTALLFAAGYLLRWRDIPRYWIWFGYINWRALPPGPGAPAFPARLPALQPPRPALAAVRRACRRR